MQEEKKMKVKKGWLAVQVGLEEEDGCFQRFVIPISYLYHPLFQRLLDKAHEVYGYHTTGPLKLPLPPPPPPSFNFVIPLLLNNSLNFKQREKNRSTLFINYLHRSAFFLYELLS
ncbi:hypothetical protein F0562_003489 [Nyssa sinensis]|uniref:Uncharacterized protein n=1 Tax=Nyssa sinensis TaxID=561372 RepID=A0A5J5BYQ0_9ASTE|nr:hypothetical protein F0562_003489 [Nyssa sinensis]